jgi:hypothetical protein
VAVAGEEQDEDEEQDEERERERDVRVVLASPGCDDT